MRPIDIIEGKVSVLDRADVDTDQIIPKQFLKRVERTGFGEFLIYDWIRDGEIELAPNPILVAGRNFGCGSSREHAPWALEDFGFEAIQDMRGLSELKGAGLLDSNLPPGFTMPSPDDAPDLREDEDPLEDEPLGEGDEDPHDTDAPDASDDEA